MKNNPKALKIIRAKYWKGQWVPESQRVLTASDQAYLAENGFEFRPLPQTHDETIREIKRLAASISVVGCLNLLSNSLATRSLKDRSYASSVLQAKMIPEHSHTGKGRCPVCGMYADLNPDLDVMIFEKIMWGGVRLSHPEYILADLRLVADEEITQTALDDLRELLVQLGKSANSLSASKTAQTLPLEKANKAEREVLCGILGICDILIHPEHRGFANGFVNSEDRSLPDQHFVDLCWPFCWYNSRFGVNWSALEKLNAL